MSPVPSVCPAVSGFPTGMLECQDRSTPPVTFTVTPTGRSTPHNTYTVSYLVGSYLVGKMILILCATSAVSERLQVQSRNYLSTEAAGKNKESCSDDIN